MSCSKINIGFIMNNNTSSLGLNSCIIRDESINLINNEITCLTHIITNCHINLSYRSINIHLIRRIVAFFLGNSCLVKNENICSYSTSHIHNTQNKDLWVY